MAYVIGFLLAPMALLIFIARSVTDRRDWNNTTYLAVGLLGLVGQVGAIIAALIVVEIVTAFIFVPPRWIFSIILATGTATVYYHGLYKVLDFDRQKSWRTAMWVGCSGAVINSLTLWLA